MTWEDCIRCRYYKPATRDGKTYKTCWHEKNKGRLWLWEIVKCPIVIHNEQLLAKLKAHGEGSHKTEEE